MSLLFLFLFGFIAGCLLCRQGPQGIGGPQGEPGPQGPSGELGLYNVSRRQAVLNSKVDTLELRIKRLELFTRI